MADGTTLLDMNNALCDFAIRWNVDGDYMRCTKCKRACCASYADEDFQHAAGCKVAGKAEARPWRAFLTMLEPINEAHRAVGAADYVRGRNDGWEAHEARARLQERGPFTGKYGDVLAPFVEMMERELHANAGKGDRPGWLKMTPAIGMLEIYYHAAKLQKAVKDGDADGIREYAADVANMSMMLVDVCGALSAQRGEAEHG